jgi:hypothetical protein
MVEVLVEIAGPVVVDVAAVTFGFCTIVTLAIVLIKFARSANN